MNIARDQWQHYRPELEKLFHHSFSRSIDPKYFDWRYFNNIHDDLLFSIKLEKSKIVSSYSAFPVELVVDGNCYKTSMSMTTMTHPDWRGRGYFPELASELYSYAKSIGIGAVWGFPNSNSHAVFERKLGWSDICEIPTMVLDSSSSEICAHPINTDVKRDDGFLLTYPIFEGDNLIRIHRTVDYLRWRYARSPVNSYLNYVLAVDGVVSSYLVTKLYNGSIDLVDIQTSSIEEALLLIRHVLRVNADLGVSQFNCWCPTHHYIYDVLGSLNFRNSSHFTYFGGRELIYNYMPKDWLNYKSWYLQMGDSDIY